MVRDHDPSCLAGRHADSAHGDKRSDFTTMTAAETTSRFAWFCLRAPARREHAAAMTVSQRVGVDVFAPRILISSTRRRPRSGAMLEALFPGYFFARFNYPNQFRHVVSTAGVTGIVSFGGQPATVPDGVIDFLRAETRLAGQGNPAPAFAAGSWVRIVSGCFREIEGRVLSFDSQSDRVRVLLSLLGRDIQVSVPAYQLVASSAEPRAYPSRLLSSANDTAPLAR